MTLSVVRSPPRPGPRLRSCVGRNSRSQVGHHAHLRWLRPALHRGTSCLRIRELPRWRGRGGGGNGWYRCRRRGARRGRGGSASTARRALQPSAAGALLHAPRWPRASRLVWRNPGDNRPISRCLFQAQITHMLLYPTELQWRERVERSGAGTCTSPEQPFPGGAVDGARLQINDRLPLFHRSRPSFSSDIILYILSYVQT